MATPLQGALHQYVDNLLETILSTTQRGCVLPAAVKYMFDFLDDLALHHAIVDPHVAHTWKSNRSRLRSAIRYYQCRINANRGTWQLFARGPLLTRDKDLSELYIIRACSAWVVDIEHV